MGWITRLVLSETAKKLLSSLLDWLKTKPYWDSVGAGLGWLAGWWADVPLEAKIVMALTGLCLFMAIRETILKSWFPQGFRNRTTQEIKRKTESESRRKPMVVPTKGGYDDLGYHGIFLKNNGDDAAYHITMEPLRMGDHSIRFIGPEVTYLEPGDTCFFHPHAAPAILLKNTPEGSPIFRMLRGWQGTIEDWGAEAEGEIQYENVDGVKYETRYTIGADVLNRIDGLVIRVKTGSNPKGNS